jgi:hypothetical protein
MASGGDVFKLQRILGHKSVTTTMRYSHLAPKAFEEDLDRFGASANEHETDEVEVLRGENRRLQAQLEALRVRLDEVGGRPSG